MTEENSKPLIRDRWWVAATMALLLWTGVRLLLSGPDAWPEALAGGLIYTAWMSWWIIRRRRKDAREAGVESSAVPGLERRMMKEDIPEDPGERQAMARLVRRRRLTLTHARWWAFPFLAVVTLGGAGLWFAMGDYALGGLMTAFGVGFLGWLAWMNRRALRRLERMEHRLGTESRRFA